MQDSAKAVEEDETKTSGFDLFLVEVCALCGGVSRREGTATRRTYFRVRGV